MWVEYVLRRLVNAGLAISFEKSEFCCPRVAYLGYLLDKKGLRPNPERIEPVIAFPVPRTVKQLRRFLGMVGWYSRFIACESEVKVPLTRLLRKDAEWQWGEAEQTAFDKLKTALTTAPVLARPDFGKTFVVQADASAYALGAVLTQEFEDGEHPIVYVSRTLNSAERNYTVTEKECLALLFAIRKFRPYLEGYKFIAITDHSALTWLRNQKEPTGRLARWVLEMQQWNFEIVHKKGALNHVPDALSREYEQEFEVAGVVVAEDPWYVRRVSEVCDRPEKFPSWQLIDGRLYKFTRDKLLDPIIDREECWRLVIPAGHRERVLRDAHCEASSGHLGVAKTYDRVAREYYWPGVWHDVHDFVRSCVQCQQYKSAQTAPQGLMGKRVVERPWAVVAADMMELPRSSNQFKHILVFQDLFTRWIELKPLKSADAKAVSSAFEELILFRWETPEFFLTDNGKEFVNKHVDGMLEEYGIRHVLTPPYHPQSDPVERTNRTLKTMIAIFVGQDQRGWDKNLHAFRHAINTATQATTKVSPAFFNFGRQPQPVKSLRREIEPREGVIKIDPAEWQDRLKRLEALRDLVARHIDEEQEKQKAHYGRGRRRVAFDVGELVLRKQHSLSNEARSFSAKLDVKYDGPFKILEVRSPEVYILETKSKKKTAMAHVSELKKWLPRRTQPRKK